MAITKMSNSGIATGGSTKYDDMLAGNSAFIPTAWNSIASATPNGVASVTFSSIPQTYKNLVIRIFARDSYSGGVIAGSSTFLQFNGDTAGNYANHQFYGNGTALTWGNQSNTTGIVLDNSCALGSNPSGLFGVGMFEISDYASTAKNKTGIGSFGVENNGLSSNTNFEVGICSGAWFNTAAINSVTVNGSYNFVTGTLITLYGIN